MGSSTALVLSDNTSSCASQRAIRKVQLRGENFLYSVKDAPRRAGGPLLPQLRPR
jgi:hypothetical protein